MEARRHRLAHVRFEGNYQLQIDPAVAAMILALRTGPPRPQLRQLFLQPPWRSLQQDHLNRLLTRPPTPGQVSLIPRGAGPSTPRAGEVADLMQALQATPPLRQAADRLLDEVSLSLQREWRQATPAQKAMLVSTTGVMSGMLLAGILANNSAREQAFDFIVDRDLPVPGVAGLSVQLKPRGARIQAGDIAGSGVSVQAAGQRNTAGQVDYEVMMTMDLAPYLHGLPSLHGGQGLVGGGP